VKQQCHHPQSLLYICSRTPEMSKQSTVESINKQQSAPVSA
jgi:hypothetical protein